MQGAAAFGWRLGAQAQSVWTNTSPRRHAAAGPPPPAGRAVKSSPVRRPQWRRTGTSRRRLAPDGLAPSRAPSGGLTS